MRWGLVSLLCFVLVGSLVVGCAKEEPAERPAVNNEVINIPIPAEVERGRPCSVPNDCGIDGCIQQNKKGGLNGEIAVCNGRRYTCDVGVCGVEDNLFEDIYCTEFGCKDLCGNGACDITYSENDKNCPQDCLGKGLVFPYVQ